MEKNIAAIVRTDTNTVRVRYANQLSDNTKLYTYVTNIPLEVGDAVVVPAQGKLALAKVIEVHEGLEIEPNSEIKYSFVVDRVNVERYTELCEFNKQIEQTVNESYKSRVRDTFRNQILSSIDDSAQSRLKALGVV